MIRRGVLCIITEECEIVTQWQKDFTDYLSQWWNYIDLIFSEIAVTKMTFSSTPRPWMGFLTSLGIITKTCLFKYTENFTTKKWKFSDKNSDIFHIYAQNIDCGYPQSMFLSRNKKNNIYPCKIQFYHIEVGFKGVTLNRHVFVMWNNTHSHTIVCLQLITCKYN